MTDRVYQRFLLLGLSVLFSFPSAYAESMASPRTVVLINRSVVKLKDLFRHAGTNAEAALGPSPAPGGHIVVQARQLAVIASRYGVKWKPDGVDQSVSIERTGTPIRNLQIKPILRGALRRAGAADHLAIAIDDTALPMVPPNAQANILVERLDFDRSTGAFQAVIAVSAPGMTRVTTTIDGATMPEVHIVIATHDLTPGEILNNDDLRQTWVPRSRSSRNRLDSLAAAIAMQVQNFTPKGSEIDQNAIKEPLLVTRGAAVSLAVDMPGLEVTAQGIALGGGGEGRVISVVNPSSHEIVEAIIDGPDHAHVLPGSMPTKGNALNTYYTMPGQ